MKKSLPLLTTVAAIIAVFLLLPPGEGRAEGDSALSAPPLAAPDSQPTQLKQLPGTSVNASPPGDQLLQQVGFTEKKASNVTAH